MDNKQVCFRRSVRKHVLCGRVRLQAREIKKAGKRPELSMPILDQEMHVTVSEKSRGLLMFRIHGYPICVPQSPPLALQAHSFCKEAIVNAQYNARAFFSYLERLSNMASAYTMHQRCLQHPQHVFRNSKHAGPRTARAVRVDCSLPDG